MRVGLFTDAFPAFSLDQLLDWLGRAVPGVRDLEIGTGGYSPAPHCDLPKFLAERSRRDQWLQTIVARDFRVVALNVSGNPLHPEREIGQRHDRDLRDTIRLAAELGVDRIVAMSGCPGAGESDCVAPHFSAGAWLPDYERIADWQWRERVQPYWAEIAEFARREYPDLVICLELHPGTYVYNAATFAQIAAIAPNVGVNLDPSHFFWQSMDPLALVRHFGGRIGQVHGKDTRVFPDNVALNGLLDNRWPGRPEDMPWNFATVGRGHDLQWWCRFVRELEAVGFDRVISIEQEDPFVPAEEAVVEAAGQLEAAIQLAQED